jgi:hypothetical protein
VHRDNKRDARAQGRSERRAVQDVEPPSRAWEPERIPPEVTDSRCEAAAPAEAELLQVGQLGEEVLDVARRPRASLDERRDVDAYPHQA